MCIYWFIVMYVYGLFVISNCFKCWYYVDGVSFKWMENLIGVCFLDWVNLDWIGWNLIL